MGVVKFLVVTALAIGGGIVGKPYIEEGLDKLMDTSKDLTACIEAQTDAVAADDYAAAQATGTACLDKTTKEWAPQNDTADPGTTDGNGTAPA